MPWASAGINPALCDTLTCHAHALLGYLQCAFMLSAILLMP